MGRMPHRMAVYTDGSPLVVWDKPPRPQTVGLVLGGGAARGVAHIGVLEVLAEHNIPIHMVAGCSVGALVGALLAAGVSPQRLHELADGLHWRDISSLSLLPQSFSEWPSLLKGIPMGILDLDRLIDWMERVLDGRLNFDDLQMPFAAIATDIVTGEAVIMNDGPVAPAVRASCSVPGIFTPYQRNGRTLVDGGVINNLPVQVVRQMGAEYVIAVDLLPAPGELRRQPENLMELTITSLYALVRINQTLGGRPAERVIAPDVDAFRLLDLAHIDELILAGRAAAEAMIPFIQADLGLGPSLQEDFPIDLVT